MRVSGWRVLCALAVVPVLACAQEPPPTPSQVIQETSEALIAQIKQHQAKYFIDQKGFIGKVADVIDPVIDMRILTALVVGKHRRTMSSGELGMLSDVLHDTLMSTYAHTLVQLENETIEVVGETVTEAGGGRKRATVKSLLWSSGRSYPIDYTMVTDRAGEYKIVNLTIRGLDIAQIFRMQFEAALKKSGGDMVEAIKATATTRPDPNQ